MNNTVFIQPKSVNRLHTLRLFVISILLILIVCVFNSCGSSNLLILSKKKHYSEKNYFYRDSSKTLINQEVRYNNPKSVDEEVWYNLKISINKNVLKKNSILNLINSGEVQTDFFIFPKESFRKSDYSILGKIELLEVQDNLLKIRENIQIKNVDTEKIYRFSGDRRIEIKE